MRGPATTRARALIWFGIPILLIAVVVGVSGLVWEARTITRLQGQIASLSRENGQLLRRVDDLTRGQQPAIPAEPAPAVRASRPETDGDTSEALSSAEQQVRRLHESLAQSAADVTRLNSRVADLEARLESAAEDNRRLSTTVEEGHKNLEDASQTMESLRAQLKFNTSRIADLEGLNTKLKDEVAGGRQSAAQTQQTITDLEGIFRRREMYLNNILRRYREITEQYRAMSGVRDGRDREAPLSSAEVSRIQNSIALAEEDLKQLTALAAQAQRLQKKLPNK